jgi:hypothetical protein
VDRAVTTGRFAGWSVVAAVVAVVTVVELLIAVDLLATGDYTGWGNWLIGAAYVAMVSVVAVWVATKRTSVSRGAWELLAVDVVALPIAAAVLSM